MKHFPFFHALALFVMLASPIHAQQVNDDEPAATLRYEYTPDGLVQIGTTDILLEQELAEGWQIGTVKGFAVLDPEGKIETFYSQAYMDAQKFSLDDLEPGYGIKAVKYFGANSMSGEEVQEILLNAFNSTFDSVCAAERKVGLIRVSTEIGLDFGLTATVKIEVEMDPREDCPQ